MRYRIGFMFVLVGLVALPLSASAQDGEKDATSEPNLEQPAPSSESAPEEPALQLKLDDAGVEVVPSPPRTDYLKAPVRRARSGLAGSVIAFGGGVAMMGVGFANTQFAPHLCFSEPCPQTPGWAIPVAVTGLVLAVGGLAGMIVTGRKLAHTKKQLRWYAGAPESRDGTPRRVQWDLAQSRVVF
jgi:hypothetical protein